MELHAAGPCDRPRVAYRAARVASATMATTTDLLLDFLGRPREVAHAVLDDTPEDLLSTPPAPGANTVAWLLWHLPAAMDEQVAQVLGYDAVGRQGVARALRPPAASRRARLRHDLRRGAPRPGLGRGPARLPRRRLRRRRSALRTVTDDDLDRVVDEDWDPPVTLGVRLVSVIDDCVQHVGQAAYASGILSRR